MGQDSWMEFWERDLPGMEHMQRKAVLHQLEVATTRSEMKALRRRLKELERHIAAIADERWRKSVAAQLWCPDCGGALGPGSWPSLPISRRTGMGMIRQTDYGVGPDDYHNRDGRRPRLINPVTGEHRWCNCRPQRARRERWERDRRERAERARRERDRESNSATRNR